MKVWLMVLLIFSAMFFVANSYPVEKWRAEHVDF